MLLCITAFYWNHNAILGLLAVYNAMQPDKENVKKQRNFWHNLAKELHKLGYNVIIAFYVHMSLKSLIGIKHN